MTNKIIIILFIVLVVISCKKLEIDKQTKCCAECNKAFSKSPVAVGPQSAKCGMFSTAEPLSKECKDYFLNTKIPPVCIGG